MRLNIQLITIEYGRKNHGNVISLLGVNNVYLFHYFKMGGIKRIQFLFWEYSNIKKLAKKYRDKK